MNLLKFPATFLALVLSGCAGQFSNIKASNDQPYVSLMDQREPAKNVAECDLSLSSAKMPGKIDAGRCHAMQRAIEPSESLLKADLKTTTYAQDADGVSAIPLSQNKRPRKTFISPSTREVGHAMYYKALQKHIEAIGTLNFPQQDGRKLYGELVISIPIFQDGSIYLKEGGVRIEKSSGNPELDKAALDIVRRAAPFGRFPPNMLSSDTDELWIVITRFKFTREEKMEAKLPSGGN